MSAGNGNPFLAGKLEYETDPVIYVTGGQEGFFDWISEQQYLFEGLRGSGKSSILRSMEWDVAWHVTDMTKVEGPPLVKQFLKKPPTYLGVRCSFEDMDIMYWDSWQAQVGRDWAQKYFGTYLEYTLLYLFLNALVGIIQKKPDLFTDPNFEKHLIEELLPIGFPNAKCRPRLPEQSLWSLRNLFRDQHFTMRDLVYRKSPLKVLSDTLPVLSPGNLIQQFGYSIKSAGFSHWKIFPLLDDCNHLTEWQVEVINSAISRLIFNSCQKIVPPF